MKEKNDITNKDSILSTPRPLREGQGVGLLSNKTIVLGVTGSIAAYKIANLASMLVKLHATVHVIMTKNACNFITPITFETITGNKCLVDTFDRNFEFNVEHVALAKRADLFLDRLTSSGKSHRAYATIC